MTTDNANSNSFLLVDAIQVEGIESIIPFAKSERPSWVHPVYKDDIAQFGPLVFDIEAAHAADQLDMLLAVVNEVAPQLHVSVINTCLPASEFAQHLKNFIFVRTAAGKELTLRFADCAVLPALAMHFTAEQWAAFHGPVTRWRVHQRDGVLVELAEPHESRSKVDTPLCLDADQVAKIKDAMLPDQILARLRDMAASDQLNGSVAEQHAWASEACRIWRASGSKSIRALENLTEIAVATCGEIFRGRGISEVLSDDANGSDETKVLQELRSSRSLDNQSTHTLA